MFASPRPASDQLRCGPVSSTKTVLDFLRPHISVGTYLYFDEFQAREHECKAFDEFLSETGWAFQVVAASRGLTHVLFQRTEVRTALPLVD